MSFARPLAIHHGRAAFRALKHPRARRLADSNYKAAHRPVQPYRIAYARILYSRPIHPGRALSRQFAPRHPFHLRDEFVRCIAVDAGVPQLGKYSRIIGPRLRQHRKRRFSSLHGRCVDLEPI